MKNTKSLGLIAIVAVITLAFTACEDPSASPQNKNFSGTVTISPSGPVAVNTELTASYDGTETVTLSWQWKKDGGAIDGVTSDKYTPDAAGSYTVTVSAKGYKSKTSAVVEVTAITTTGIGTPIVNAEISIIAPVKDVAPHTTAIGTGSFTIGAVSWSPDDNPFKGGVVYTATVTLTADTSYTFTGLTHATINGQAANVSNNTGAAVTLSHTFPATDTRTATAITINAQPSKLTYTHGETLDLTGLAITLTFDNGSADDVKAEDFADHNITADPAHGDHLDSVTHNGHPVKVEYGNLEVDTDNLTVSPPKAAGAAVSAPTASAVAMTAVTLNALTASTGQSVEYGINTVNTAPSSWQTSTAFSGLTVNTMYYFFARSAGNSNYETGAASGGTAIATKQTVTVLDYWVDDIGNIVIGTDGEPITGAINLTRGDSVTFTANAAGYSAQQWTINGANAGTGNAFTFNTVNREPERNYTVGLRVQKSGKFYFTEITVRVQE